jgi:purine-cytosine permease-like protein
MVKKYVDRVTPASRTGRLVVGILCIFGGLLGFLPVLGFWMVPLGLIILSVDFPFVRRFRRRSEVRLGRWWRKRRARKAEKNNRNQ